MRYLDRSGQSINSLEWAKLFCDPHYAIVRRSRTKADCEVVTSWVGIWSEAEREAKIFLVHVRAMIIINTPEGKRTDYKDVNQLWFKTEEQALECHQAMESVSAIKKARITT